MLAYRVDATNAVNGQEAALASNPAWVRLNLSGVLGQACARV